MSQRSWLRQERGKRVTPVLSVSFDDGAIATRTDAALGSGQPKKQKFNDVGRNAGWRRPKDSGVERMTRIDCHTDDSPFQVGAKEARAI